MKRHRSLRKPLLLILFLQTITLVSGTTYYVDSVSGNDLADGTTLSTPWASLVNVNAQVFQPGDNILFKRGGEWLGQLTPQGSGSASAPIILDAYGEGDLPHINGDGLEDAAVLLYNVEYWEVQNLEVTNPADSDSIFRIGVRIYHDTGTVANHIYLRKLWVHDVRGDNNSTTGKATGGIQLNAGGTFLHYNDVLIEDCVVHDVSRVGITVNGAASNNTAPPTGYGTNIIMRGNLIYNTGGDGSIIRYCDHALIEYNVVHDFPTAGSGAGYVAGLWVRSTRHAVMQYNEVYNADTNLDGQAYDSDIYCEDTIVQYNYSHNNSGGFMLIMGEGSRTSHRTVIRYNVSVNDRGSLFLFSLGTAPETWIYNNTFYIAPGMSTKILNRNRGDTGGSKIYFFNNIVYNLGSGGYASFASLVANSNCYYGNHPSGEPLEANKLTVDPELVNPGASGTGFTGLTGYCLKPTSPMINSGLNLSDPGEVDFFGNLIEDVRMDRGAHEFPPAARITAMNFSRHVSLIEFTTTVNRSYVLERSDSLDTEDWEQIGEPVSGTGHTQILIDSGAEGKTRRFYRIRSR